jgi:hypothetical protein
MDGVLVLASALMRPDDIRLFLGTGGIEIFNAGVQTKIPRKVSAALKFGLVVPSDLLPAFAESIATLVPFLENRSSAAPFVIQFLARFPADIISKCRGSIAQAMSGAASSVTDQETFNAITELFTICSGELSDDQMTAFASLLNYDVLVPAPFASALLQTKDMSEYPNLLLNAFRASLRSDIHQVLIESIESHELAFEDFGSLPNFVPVLTQCLESNSPLPALFLLFCIAAGPEASEFLAESTLTLSLIEMKGYTFHRLQIFTILCQSPAFCKQTTSIEGIVNLLVSALAVEQLEDAGMRLMASLSQHKFGCGILCEFGVLAFFAQHFLSSASSGNRVGHAILRSVASHRIEIPQGSLIVSCLMQDLASGSADRVDILDTIAAIAGITPDSVQEQDLQRIIVRDVAETKSAPLLMVALHLISVVDPTLLRTCALPLLSTISRVLGNQNLLYPQIILGALDVIVLLTEQMDTREIFERLEFERYVTEIIQLMDPSDPYRESISTILSLLSAAGTTAPA